MKRHWSHCYAFVLFGWTEQRNEGSSTLQFPTKSFCETRPARKSRFLIFTLQPMRQVLLIFGQICVVTRHTGLKCRRHLKVLLYLTMHTSYPFLKWGQSPLDDCVRCEIRSQGKNIVLKWCEKWWRIGESSGCMCCPDASRKFRGERKSDPRAAGNRIMSLLLTVNFKHVKCGNSMK